MKNRLFLVDGSGFIFRAFFSLPPLSNSKGTPTNAVLGFGLMMKKLLEEHQPTHVAVVFDTKEPTFRHKMFPEYKANRPEPPPELIPQFALVGQLVDAFRWKRLEMPGFEADDIIGTLADKASKEGFEVVIVTSDKDLWQIVGKNVRILDTMKDRWTGVSQVRERFGGGPKSVVDFLAMAGDSSDNVPGIPGVGEKTAKKLMAQFGSLDAVLARAEEIPGKLGEKVRDNKDKALLARELVKLRRDLDTGVELDDLEIADPDMEALGELLTSLEMTRFLQDLQAELAEKIGVKGLSRDKYKLILDEQSLKSMAEKFKRAGTFALDLETTALEPMKAKIVGLSFCCDEEEAFYLPVAHSYLGVPEQIGLERVMEVLGPILGDASILKVGQNIKYDWIILKNAGIGLEGVVFDTMVGSYLLNPEIGAHNMDVLSLRYLGHKTITYKDVAGSGREALRFPEVPLDRARDYAAEDAHVTYLLWKKIAPKLVEEGLDKLMAEVEMPLVEVLVDMERAGVLIDVPLFEKLSAEAAEKLVVLEKKIHEAAGVDFNLNSPKQVSEVLFEKLGLPTGRKTKTGYSTDVEVLEKLAGKHPVPELLLDYRAFHKLKSTYIDALPKMLNPETGRLHTSFNQAVTATGRLSSSDPNLQNIPIRTPEGRRIREGFIAGPGRVLLSADYSQVELRVLAHLSGDEAMIRAFARGEDIHRATAAEVFGVEPEIVTGQMRRQAKAVNFGVLYGMSAFRLGRDLKIGTKKAKAFIDGYFGRFPRVKEFIDKTIEDAAREGLVTTVMGRRQPIPELRSGDRNVAGFGERMAVNTPIQGSAADIIKVAMVRVQREIARTGLDATMILQVHDELLFEVGKDRVDEVKKLVREAMEGVWPLNVPLTVEVEVGENWAQAH